MIEDDGQKYGEDSEFNAGIATLRRLDELKKHLDAATADDNPDMQYKYCKAFWKELDCMLSKSKGKEDISEREYQTNQYQEIEEVKYKFDLNLISKRDMLKLLDQWELELRRIEQEHSLNMPMGKDSRWALSTKRR